MKNINDVLLYGKIASDISLKETERSSYVRFSVSITRKLEWEEWVEFRTNYVPVIAWWRLAEKVSQYKKGDDVIVQGKLDSNQYETEDWEKRTNVQVVANNVDKTNEQLVWKNINKMTIYGNCSSIDETKIKKQEDGSLAIRTSIATNEYIRKADFKEDAEFDDKFDKKTVWTNIRMVVSKSFYENNIEPLIWTTGHAFLLEGNIMTTSFENEEWKKIYYTYLNVIESWIISIFEKGKSSYFNDKDWISEDELRDEFKSESKKETVKTKKTNKDEPVKKSRFEEEDDYEEVKVEEVPF